MISAVDIHKSFGDNYVLKGISAEFKAGKSNLIIGTSGSGKTVFMKCLIGLFTPEQGEILYDGRNYGAMSKKEQKVIRNEIGMLFQGSALFDSMTVEENIRFPLDMFTSMNASEKADRVNFCLNRVNLENKNKLFPAEISGGMMKRVGIARAIVLNPKYLFCDEPNSGLDPKTSMVIDELIMKITEEFQITTIINTHDMNSVMTMGDQVVFLHQGLKHWEGNKDEILNTDDELLSDFIFASDFLKALKDRRI